MTYAPPLDAPPDPASCSTCSCSDSNVNALDRESPGAIDHASPCGDYSDSGVRYFNGGVSINTTDLSSSGLSAFYGQTRAWTNQFAITGTNGSGFMISQQPYLHQNDSGSVIATFSPDNTLYYDYNGTSYAPHWDNLDQLTYNSNTNLFTLVNTMGDQIQFYGFNGMSSQTLPGPQQGAFAGIIDPYGQATQVTYNANGYVTQVTRPASLDGTTTESYLYSYIASGVNAGLLGQVTLQRQVSGQSPYIVRQVVYTYYDGVVSYGNQGDLKLAQIEDGSGNVLQTKYYRYYVAGDSNGYLHGLKYQFSPQSYARLAAAVSNPFTATDSTVAPYADGYFQYNSNLQVTQAVIQGVGCTSCSGGQGTYTYSYTTSSNPNGANSWATKTVETLPDGNQDIIYSNYIGQTMLKVYVDTASGNKWEWFNQYGSDGRLLLQAMPSALTGYNDAYADLLHSVSGNYQYMSNNSGLVKTIVYKGPLDVGPGFYGGTKVQQGQQGAGVWQESV